MKFPLAVIIFLFFAGACFASSKIYLENDSLDLGEIPEGKIHAASFSVENKGGGPLEIKAVTAGCGCVKIISPLSKVSISPGEKAKIKFTLDSTGFSEDIEKFIYITTNDPIQPQIRFLIKAKVSAKSQTIIERFRSFSPLAVICAGLADGINPCAFTVLVFFISFLTFAGYSRSQMFIIGLIFIFSVFITYFLVGLGMFESLRRLEIFHILSRVIYVITGAAAFILGGVSLYDFWIFRRTRDPEKMKLQLPALVKHQIHKIIRTDLGRKKAFFSLIVATLICGFLVSFLELICTGQLYLPTIVYILKVETLRLKALLYLVLYNIMFVVPLLIILLLAAGGVTSQGFAKLAGKNLAGIKLITAFIFFGLGLLLFFMKG